MQQPCWPRLRDEQIFEPEYRAGGGDVLLALVGAVFGDNPVRVQYGQALADPAWAGRGAVQVRAARGLRPDGRSGAGLAGAVLYLLRNPLADPGVLGVSATAALGGGAIVLGAAAIPDWSSA